MKKILGAVAVVALCGMMSRAWAQHIEVIYGDDDRLDIYQVSNAKLLKMADSTVALFEGSNVKVEGDKALLTTRSYGQGMSLCKEEPFYEQRNGAFCSGSLVGPDLLMTAGHCVETEYACKDAKFVFGFNIKKKGANPDSVPAAEVYGCAKLIGRAQVDDGADWALVQLDRRVLNHAPLKLNRTGKIADKTPLIVIGHPAGLPTKVAGGATVRDASPEGYFVANLDTYGGNSGSAVFNAGTGLVEGILVRGENDYVWKGSCRVSNKCPADGCRGEDVTKISAVSAGVPKTMAESHAEVRFDTAFLQLLDQASSN
ncbi:MAG: trypsin-like peptidase domain-containing protein [Elusimicrobia bacterium]|nr:trypsin-like peptidase domain-containing protein [Elusimicrobiota bacterium]